MLGRFRKKGGFQQLLTLIETCEPSKRNNLFHLVATEDPGWAHLVKAKSLSMERISEWPQEILMEITPHLQDRVLAVAYAMAAGDKKSKWLSSVPKIKAREIEQSVLQMPVTEDEKFASTIKIIQTVRELESKGLIKFAQFDPSLVIDQRLAA